MQIALRSGDSGTEAGTLSVSDAVFAAPYNERRLCIKNKNRGKLK